MFGLRETMKSGLDEVTALAELSGMRDAQAIILKLGIASGDMDVKVASVQFSDAIERAIKAKQEG